MTESVLVPVRHGQTSSPITAIVGDHITRQMEGSGRFYEWDLLEAIQSHMRPGVYVDAGAHIGNHSVFFALHCPSSEVHAFEPNPAVGYALADNAARYGFNVHPVAVHDELASVAIADRFEGNHGMAVAVAGNEAAAVRLDDYLLDRLRAPLAVIKVDVEGGEWSVLRSALSLIARDRPLIACEAISTTRAVDGLLMPLGYLRDDRTYGKTPTHIWIP